MNVFDVVKDSQRFKYFIMFRNDRLIVKVFFCTFGPTYAEDAYDILKPGSVLIFIQHKNKVVPSNVFLYGYYAISSPIVKCF